ncbi:MAG TPA: hypothetical protein VK063_02370 [Beutenbergiaceae bacterium]|nr:hypothetical protein [Beutenbergiaceae bacterium]
MVSIAVNGHPRAALYMRADDDVHRAFRIQHLSVTNDGVTHVTA